WWRRWYARPAPRTRGWAWPRPARRSTSSGTPSRRPVAWARPGPVAGRPRRRYGWPGSGTSPGGTTGPAVPGTRSWPCSTWRTARPCSRRWARRGYPRRPGASTPAAPNARSVRLGVVGGQHVAAEVAVRAAQHGVRVVGVVLRVVVLDQQVRRL